MPREVAIRRTAFLIAATFLFAAIAASNAFADCSNPSGAAGDITYNQSFKVMEYCDGAGWIAMHKPGSGSGGCSNPSTGGTDGWIRYNSSTHQMVSCAGNQWKAMGPMISAPTGGLVGYWKMDETGSTTTALDSSGNGHDGTMQGGLSGANSTTGIVGTALTFDGSGNCIDLGGDSAVLPDAFTVTAWVNYTDPSPATRIFFGWASGGGLPNLYIDNATYNWPLMYMGNTNFVYFKAAPFNSTGWHHVAYVLPGSAQSDITNAKMYVDGNETPLYQLTSSGGQNTKTNAVIGASGGCGGGGFKGDLDEVRLYDRALSAAEVKAVYLASGGTSNPDITTGLVAHWKLDETGGTSVADSSGQGNDGTWNGTAAVQSVAGHDSTALDFDISPATEVTVPDSPELDISGTDITLAMWVYPESGSGDQALINKTWNNDLTYPYYQYAIEYDDMGATDQFRFIFGDTGGGLNNLLAVGPTTIGAWQHLAFTYDGTRTVGYINGVQKDVQNNTNSIEARGLLLRLGSDFQSGQHFNGYLDDVRVYNRALSAQDVAALADADSCTNPVGPEGAMIFNTSEHVMQYCDGANWIAIGPAQCPTFPYCGGNDSYKLAFMTSQTYTGDMGGVGGADANCQSLANAAGLKGTYYAWLSSIDAANDSPADRFTQASVPYFLVDGSKLADNWSDLTDGGLDRTLSVTDQGNDQPFNNTWTNVTTAGAHYGDAAGCDSWSDGTSGANGAAGSALTAGTGWTNNGVATCDTPQHLYCFEQ